MALLAPNEGEVEILRRMVMAHIPVAGDTLKLRLYKNNKTPAEGDTFLQYTQCNGTGYAPIALVGTSWTITTQTGDSSSASYAQQTFTFTAGTGDTSYGYYITSHYAAGDTRILWAEKYTDGPYVIPSGGGTIKITPRIVLD